MGYTSKHFENPLIIFNQDPLAANNSLIVTGNSIVVYDRTDIITSFQYVPETEPDLPTQHLENANVLNNYFPDIAFDDLTFSIEPIEEELDILPSQPDADIVLIRDTENEVLTRLIKDLTEVKEEVFIRHNPLIGINFKEKLREILNKEADNSKDKIQKIHNNLRKALGPRRAARA
ncbi:9710_t:CDS:2 [Ambispora leptoticha]|uniref:9710_t:CDS:1 n=1 Tax=Ambispora leptoticha TaxID=144679 RepID=A0A9N9DIP2_9GLOM|nr:9710_t:CDS:2 [Ambispora leptoticha]